LHLKPEIVTSTLSCLQLVSLEQLNLKPGTTACISLTLSLERVKHITAIFCGVRHG
jgi:hypothetical protein